MAKKRREWKAWMVVDKHGDRIVFQWYKKWLPQLLRTGERIIRVRIVEDK